MNAGQKHWIVDHIVASVVKATQGIGNMYDDEISSSYMQSSIEPLFLHGSPQLRALSQSWYKSSAKIEVPTSTR
mgnify:CR=1 FL=1